MRIIQIGMIGSLYTVRKKDLFCRIFRVFRVLPEDNFFERLIQADAQMALFPSGKQDPDQGDLGHKSKAELPGEGIGVLRRVIPQMIYAADNRCHGFLFDCLRQGINVFVMGVKG